MQSKYLINEGSTLSDSLAKKQFKVLLVFAKMHDREEHKKKCHIKRRMAFLLLLEDYPKDYPNATLLNSITFTSPAVFK